MGLAHRLEYSWIRLLASRLAGAYSVHVEYISMDSSTPQMQEACMFVVSTILQVFPAMSCSLLGR